MELFLDSNKQWITDSQIRETLLQLGADQCDYLFIHTALNFGIPNPALKRAELMESLLQIIKGLGVRNVMMPTFTFSFCNKRDYNPATSVSKMGMLNEYFRKQPDVIRSIDPLMSVALLGDDVDLVKGVGHYSCGENSTFDKLHHRENVKFLMFGPKIGYCLTYMHYLEWLFGVEYRYNRAFVGNIQNGDEVYQDEYQLFTRYNGVTPNDGSYRYEQFMYDAGVAEHIGLGGANIAVVEEKEATEMYFRCLQKDPNYFVDFHNGQFFKDTTYITTSEVVAM